VPPFSHQDSFTFATPAGEIQPTVFAITVASMRQAPEVLAPGQMVTLLDGCRIADVLAGTVRYYEQDEEPGLAVVGISGKGQWQYTLDGVRWLALEGVGNQTALLLGPASAIRFIPLPGWAGVVRLTYRAWDRSTGRQGDRIDLSNRQTVGGQTAFSKDGVSATTTVVPPTPEATPVVVEPWQGEPTVAELVGSAAAIVRLEGAGSWQFSLDGGRSWNDCGSVYHGRALLLRGTDRVRFLPRRDGLGKVILGGRPWNGTGGLPGGHVNLAGRSVIGPGTPYAGFLNTRNWRLSGD